MLAWRARFHHARLAEHITPYVSLDGQPLSKLASMVQQQAQFMSCLDVFHVLGLVALIVCPVSLLLGAGKRDQRRKPAEGVSYEH